MSDERVLRDDIPVIGRIDLRELERTEPIPSERFSEAIPLALTWQQALRTEPHRWTAGT